MTSLGGFRGQYPIDLGDRDAAVSVRREFPRPDELAHIGGGSPEEFAGLLLGDLRRPGVACAVNLDCRQGDFDVFSVHVRFLCPISSKIFRQSVKSFVLSGFPHVLLSRIDGAAPGY